MTKQVRVATQTEVQYRPVGFAVDVDGGVVISFVEILNETSVQKSVKVSVDALPTRVSDALLQVKDSLLDLLIGHGVVPDHPKEDIPVEASVRIEKENP